MGAAKLAVVSSNVSQRGEEFDEDEVDKDEDGDGGDGGGFAGGMASVVSAKHDGHKWKMGMGQKSPKNKKGNQDMAAVVTAKHDGHKWRMGKKSPKEAKSPPKGKYGDKNPFAKLQSAAKTVMTVSSMSKPSAFSGPPPS